MPSSSETSSQPGSWSEGNLKPIAWALALALLILVVPVAYRISKCADFAMGLSLSQLFSFKCTAIDKPIDIPHPVTSPPPSVAHVRDESQPTVDQLRARTLMLPEGYVSYRVSGGFPRMDTGALKPANGDQAPPYDAVKEGLILRAVADKPIHQRPYSSSDYVTDHRGQCYQVIHGDAIQDEKPAGDRSGGWLPVRRSACDQSYPTPTHPIEPKVVKPLQISRPASSQPAAPEIPKAGSVCEQFSGLTQADWKSRYHLAVTDGTYHIFVHSLEPRADEADADAVVRSWNGRFAARGVWFEKMPTAGLNGSNQRWAIVVGEGLGRKTAQALTHFVRQCGIASDAHAFQQNVGPAPFR